MGGRLRFSRENVKTRSKTDFSSVQLAVESPEIINLTGV